MKGDISFVSFINLTVRGSSEVCNANISAVTEVVHVNEVSVNYNLGRDSFQAGTCQILNVDTCTDDGVNQDHLIKTEPDVLAGARLQTTKNTPALEPLTHLCRTDKFTILASYTM